MNNMNCKLDEQMILELNEEKAKTLIAYIASKCDIGKTKLMKLLYLIDFTMYEKYGESITNDRYEHWPYGPVPVTIWVKVSDEYLVDLLSVEKIEFNQGTYQKFTPKEEINLGIFSKEEIEVVNQVIVDFGEKDQSELVEMVHNEFPYKITDEDEEIPYFLACYRNYGDKEKKAQYELIINNKELMKRVEKKCKEAFTQFKKSRHLQAS